MPARPLSVPSLGGPFPTGQPANQERDSIPPLLSFAEAGVRRNFGEPAAPPISGSKRWFKGGGGKPVFDKIRHPYGRFGKCHGLHFLRGGEGRSGTGLGIFAGRWSSVAGGLPTQKSRHALGSRRGRGWSSGRKQCLRAVSGVQSTQLTQVSWAPPAVYSANIDLATLLLPSGTLGLAEKVRQARGNILK